MDYSLRFDAIWRNFDLLLSGLGVGLLLAVASIGVGAVIGFFVAFGLLSDNPVVSRACQLYVTILRNIPVLLVIFFVFFAMPQLGLRMDKVTSFIAALSIYSGAALAETFRGGLLAVSRGLTEAGQSIGLRPLQIKVYVVLPVMLRIVLPSLGNSFISLFKDTSLAATIAVPELTYYARKINVESFRVIETWMITSFLYVATTIVITTVLRLIEGRLSAQR
ncbi:amino acid ABC transporter permease [Brucella intermedia]|uniref:amino acid ABC transporter permease n=1 Tax=Brucella intermedia TaxID=94625 RepID=UPI00224B5CFD|nr:amino acid ABC transporter permease [Brucella intermedia]